MPSLRALTAANTTKPTGLEPAAAILNNSGMAQPSEIKRVRTATLDVAYEESGPADLKLMLTKAK